MNENKKVLTWLKNHGVSSRGLRYALGVAWVQLGRIGSKISKIIGMRIRFVSAVIIGGIAYLLVSQIAFLGRILGALALGLAVAIGLVEELREALNRSK